MEAVLLLIILFLLFVLGVVSVWKKAEAIDKSVNLPPGPWRIPIIGNMHQMAGSLPHRRLKDLSKKYGPLMHLRLGEVTNIIVSSPEMAKEVMRTHDLAFCERPFVLALHILFYNSSDIVFAPYGDYWRQMRKLCVVELLSAKRVQSFRGIREEEMSNLITCVSSSSARGTAGSAVINLSKVLYSLSYSIIARVAFGNKCKDQEAFIQAVEVLATKTGGFSIADLFPSIKFLKLISGMEPTIRKLHRQLDMILESIINEHKIKNKKNMGGVHEFEADDLVDVLLHLQEHGKLEIPLSDNNVKAVIMDIFIAAGDTSATTTEWAFSELLKNPRVMRKAQAEVRRVFHEQGDVKEAGLEELKYLKAVVRESMRLHPALPLLLPRECRQECEINGYHIPAKAKVLVNAWAIGRDPDYWIEPETFIPERFMESSIDYKGANFEYVPFGAGRRMCPGILFGVANVELPLAHLLYHFDWQLPAGGGGTRNEDFDMTEEFGASVKRKNDLFVLPVPYHPLRQ